MSQPAMNSAKMEECRKACHNCSVACFQALRFVLSESQEHIDHHTILTLQICADICQLSAKAMALGSDLHAYTCGACAEICTRCADECERLTANEVLRNCADACHKCAESCEEMSHLHKPARIREVSSHVPH